MKQCEICNIIFDNLKVYSNHIRWNHKRKDLSKKECSVCHKKIALYKFANHEKVCIKTACKYCGKKITDYRKKFCDQSCSATYNNKKRNINRSYITPEWREKQRQRAIEQWKRGTHKISRKIFSSKNERAIVKYIKEQYPNDEWKNGGRLVLRDGTFLARDLWSDKLKVCFEYDGIWHFKNIKKQLKKKQAKDRLLEEWCKENNYRLIRVDEENYLDVKQIENLIYNSKEQIIKVGSRYS